MGGYSIPTWVWAWGLCALCIVVIAVVWALVHKGKSILETIKVCLITFYCVFPCLWCPASTIAYFCVTKKCPLCGGRRRKPTLISPCGSSHPMKCHYENRLEFGAIPKSHLYKCRWCNAMLKLWPIEKIEKMECAKCGEEVTNTGSNLHYCYFCDEALCGNHRWQDDDTTVVDFRDIDSIPAHPQLPVYPGSQPDEPDEPDEPQEEPTINPSSSFGVDWNAIREHHIRERERRSPRPTRPSTNTQPTNPPSAPQPSDLPDYPSTDPQPTNPPSAPQPNDPPDYLSHVDKPAPYDPTAPITPYTPTAPYGPTPSTPGNPSTPYNPSTPLLDHDNTPHPATNTETYTDFPPSYHDVMNNDDS